MSWAGAVNARETTGLARLCCILNRWVRTPGLGVPGGEQPLRLGPMTCHCVAFEQEESPWRSGCQAS